MSKLYGQYVAIAIAAALLGLMGSLAMTGNPEPGSIQRFEPNGIMAAQPADIVRIEIVTADGRIAFRRTNSTSWLFEVSRRPVPSELAAHVDTALRFMHVSAPARLLDSTEYGGMNFGDFGLDPPAYVISLGLADGSVIADFGALNPAGTSQYVRMLGSPTLYLMSRHVGAEWQIAADMATRMSPPEPGSEANGRDRGVAVLSPVSVDRLGAIELVTGAKLHRFERDNAGNWFLHVGQHVHSANTPAHVADPVQAKRIAATLAAFDRVQVENVIARHPGPDELDRYGLSRPALVVLAYARDSSTPLARIDFGVSADDRFSRYARVSVGGDVVKIAAYQADRLFDLLKVVGTGS